LMSGVFKGKGEAGGGGNLNNAGLEQNPYIKLFSPGGGGTGSGFSLSQ